MKIRSRPSIGAVVPLILGLALLTGCQAVLTPYRGRTVVPDARIPLPGGETDAQKEGAWAGDNVVVTYRIQAEGSRIILKGTTEFTGHVRDNFTSLKSFTLRAYFLDPSGRVLKTVAVDSAAYRKPIGDLRFERTLTPPPDAAALAFGYRGRALLTGGTQADGGDWSFWHHPFE